MRLPGWRTARGMTFVELMATVTIMLILAAVILPVSRTLHKRQREIELHRALREIRTAIDDYKGQEMVISPLDKKLGNEGYPEDLETLVEGVRQVGKIDVKLKFLRHVPKDPMTGSDEWGRRCYQDAPDSTSWCGDNVYDVYTKSEGVALDGSEYKTW
jgi:general secretion pathway protein G